MNPGDRIRIVVGSRHNDWQKGDSGEITKVIALPPQNQKTIYIVKLDRSGNSFWVTDDQVVSFEQLSIFDIELTSDQSPTQTSETSDSQGPSQAA